MRLQKHLCKKDYGEVGKKLGITALAICVLVFIIGLFRQIPKMEIFMSSVGLAVAAIPEGLPTVVTIMLSIGITRMARKNSIIRKLPAVETLGSSTVIASDKTGTLTQNKMQVVEIFSMGGNNQNQILRLGAMCTDCSISNGKIEGEATEKAIVEAASNLGENKNRLYEEMPRINDIPFDSVRVIAIAYKDLDTLPNKIDNTLENDLTFCGLLGMIDPPREGVKEAIAECKRAGIKTVMITGDHILTAKAIAEKLGILRFGDVAITGQELDKISDKELEKNIMKYSVFARVSPEHKVRIVKAFRSQGNVVAMTGDRSE